MWLVLAGFGPESLSRDELFALVRRRYVRVIALAVAVGAQRARIAVFCARLAGMMGKSGRQSAVPARLRYLLPRNGGSSLMLFSEDDGPGRTPPRMERRARPSGRVEVRRPGVPGISLCRRGQGALDGRRDRFPEGACGCGVGVGAAAGPGAVCGLPGSGRASPAGSPAPAAPGTVAWSAVLSPPRSGARPAPSPPCSAACSPEPSGSRPQSMPGALPADGCHDHRPLSHD